MAARQTAAATTALTAMLALGLVGDPAVQAAPAAAAIEATTEAAIEATTEAATEATIEPSAAWRFSSPRPPPRAAALDKLADIQAVYAWMSPDIDTVNLVMTVSAFDDGTAQFGPGFQYVFHLAPHRSLTSAPEQQPPTTPGGEPRSGEVDIICQFPGPNEIECWVGRTLYVRGNPTSTTGLKTKELRIFAGRRSDPFFFNDLGLDDAQDLLRVHTPPGGAQQCSAISPSDATAIQSKLRGEDRYSDTNVLALVIAIKKNQLNVTNRAPFLSVWGSTHRR